MEVILEGKNILTMEAILEVFEHKKKHFISFIQFFIYFN